MVTRRCLWIAFLLCFVGLGCSNSTKPVGQEDTVATTRAALSGPIQGDFEDGTLQGWVPRGSVGLTNTTESSYSGTHSLKTAARTAAWMGPSLVLTGQLSQGTTYQVKAAIRLAPGEAATNVSMTVERHPADGSATAYDSIVYGAAATDGGWVVLSGNYQFTSDASTLILYIESSSATASYYVDGFSLSELNSVSSDFEDGTAQGWSPRGSVTLTNTTEIPAAGGTHSLKVTGRTATWMGPSYNLLNRITKGASYQVTVSGRLVAGSTADTLFLGVQRTSGSTTSYDTIKTAAVTDSAWVMLTGVYSFTTDVTAISAYVQTMNASPNFYIDSFSVTLLAPAPGAPPNTTGASMDFETGKQGWVARGSVNVAQSQADKHGGNSSLLTTGRTATWMGPSLDVTNLMFNGSRYRVSLWAKLAPGMADNKLRVSLQRTLGTVTDYTAIIPNTTVTAGAWVRLSATFDLGLANTNLTMYVESDGSLNGGTSDFYIDDVSITYIQPAAAEHAIASAYQSLASYFPLGAAVDSLDITGERAFLLTKHFNSITSGNDMKWTGLQNVQGTFTFATADAEVTFAKANNMAVRGHTLIWHNQTPVWVFNDASGNPMTATPDNQALLTQRIQTHIQTVLTHFGADVPVWDVINEAIDETQPDGLRRSPWYNVLGPQYIDIALRAARAAAPNAKLYINEYNTTIPTKRAFLAQVVGDLKARGVPIDGVGHQMHANVEWPSAADITSTINLFDGLGVENEITELDISIYSGSYPQVYGDYLDIPTDRFALQGYQTRDYFSAFKQLQGKIKRVTFWGVSDDRTWLNTGSKIDGPLMFDTSFKAKPEYWGIVDPVQLPGADVAVTMTTETPTVAAGQAITFDITVKNNPDSDPESWKPTTDDLPATNVQLATAIPANTVFQALEIPAGWTCTTPAEGSTGPVSCTITSLAVGTASTFGLTVAATQCSTPDTTPITATANVTSTTRDPNTAPNNTATASGQVSNPVPVVAMNGSPAMSLECPSSFLDPGATANDTCQGAVPVTTSGTVNSNQVGAYTLGYSATDAAGGRSLPVTRAVNVVDTTAPVLTLAGANSVALECPTPFVDPGATAVDACQGSVPVTTSGMVNPNMLGSYALGYGAVDAQGNAATPVSRVISVVDTTAPVLTLAGADPMTLECRSVFVDPGATASDSCAGTLAVTEIGVVNANVPASYTVGYSTSDSSGNTANASRTVVVQDTGAPMIEAIDLTIVAPFGVRIVVNNGKITIGGHTMPLIRGAFRFGSHLFRYDGTTLTMDGEPVPLDGTTILLRDPHDQNVTFTIADLVASVSDTCDATLDLSKVVISRVSSDESEDQDHWGWGRDRRTERDVTIASDCKSVQLRDERNMRGNGRVYSIELGIRDASGNRSFKTAKVMVPTIHHAAVDDGPAYTVTSTCL
jgi:endo-1,4-beta-xylanase